MIDLGKIVTLGLAISMGASVVTGQDQPSLAYPVDIVADGTDLIVADFKAHGLFRLDGDGDLSPIATGEGLPRTPLYGTRAVIPAPDGGGWLVADPATFALYRVGTNGALSVITTQLDVPQGLVAFDEESVLVSDLRGGIGAVIKVNLDGTDSVFAEVDSPKGIVADGADGFAVVSHGARAVFMISREGQVRTLASGAPLDFPHDIVRLDDGSFIVSDGYAKALFRVSRDGAIDVVAQGDPMMNPQGLTFDSQGNLVVVDPQAGAIFRVTLDGEITPVYRIAAGSATSRLP